MTLDGKVLGVLGQAGRQPKQFGWIHQMACPAKDVLYVGVLLIGRVKTLMLHRGRASMGSAARLGEPGGTVVSRALPRRRSVDPEGTR